MKKILWGLAVMTLLGCGKKKEIAEPIQPVSLDLAILSERNLDSLSRQEYAARLLAFAIDLGQRNLDLDRRIGLILSVSDGTQDWHEGVEAVIERDNYKLAETRYLAYLAKYDAMLSPVPAEWDSSHTDLLASRDRLKASYDVIRGHSDYGKLPAMLDTLLSNDLSINRSLRLFEQRIKKDVLP